MVIEAIEDFSYEWEERYEENPWSYLEDIHVQFYGKTHEEWTTPGCYRGITPHQQKIQVGYVTDQGIWPLNRTAFWHELVHLHLWVSTRDPDANHEEPGGPWKEHHNEMVRDLKQQWAEKYPLDTHPEMDLP